MCVQHLIFITLILFSTRISSLQSSDHLWLLWEVVINWFYLHWRRCFQDTTLQFSPLNLCVTPSLPFLLFWLVSLNRRHHRVTPVLSTRCRCNITLQAALISHGLSSLLLVSLCYILSSLMWKIKHNNALGEEGQTHIHIESFFLRLLHLQQLLKVYSTSSSESLSGMLHKFDKPCSLQPVCQPGHSDSEV